MGLPACAQHRQELEGKEPISALGGKKLLHAAQVFQGRSHHSSKPNWGDGYSLASENNSFQQSSERKETSWVPNLPQMVTVRMRALEATQGCALCTSPP